MTSLVFPGRQRAEDLICDPKVAELTVTMTDTIRKQ